MGPRKRRRTAERSARTASSSPGATRSDSNNSSVASSPAESIAFRFLNFASPSDSRNAQIRRDIRSHVTTRQHRMHRQVMADRLQADQRSPTDAEATSPHADASVDNIETSSADGTSQPPTPPEAAAGTTDVRHLPQIDFSAAYPPGWQPFLRPILNHYLTNMAVDVHPSDSASRTLLNTHVRHIILSDLVSTHAVILLGAAHLFRLRSSNDLNILQLKAMAIHEINRVLNEHGSSGRAISDQMIIAVAKMATFELLFGTQETFHTHMTGLQRMVSLRGGLPSLGCHGLLARSLLWLDANAAEMRQSALYFPPDSYPAPYVHPHPDRAAFVWGVSRSP